MTITVSCRGSFENNTAEIIKNFFWLPSVTAQILMSGCKYSKVLVLHAKHHVLIPHKRCKERA